MRALLLCACLLALLLAGCSESATVRASAAGRQRIDGDCLIRD